jgi:hypothetical protein
MIRVSATGFGKQVGRYQDIALAEPVVVTRNGRDRTVLISAAEYLRLKRRDRQVFAAGELPDDMLDAIRNAEVDERRQVAVAPASNSASRTARLVIAVMTESSSC